MIFPVLPVKVVIAIWPHEKCSITMAYVKCRGWMICMNSTVWRLVLGVTRHFGRFACYLYFHFIFSCDTFNTSKDFIVLGFPDSNCFNTSPEVRIIFMYMWFWWVLHRMRALKNISMVLLIFFSHLNQSISWERLFDHGYYGFHAIVCTIISKKSEISSIKIIFLLISCKRNKRWIWAACRR